MAEDLHLKTGQPLRAEHWNGVVDRLPEPADDPFSLRTGVSSTRRDVRDTPWWLARIVTAVPLPNSLPAAMKYGWREIILNLKAVSGTDVDYAHDFQTGREGGADGDYAVSAPELYAGGAATPVGTVVWMRRVNGRATFVPPGGTSDIVVVRVKRIGGDNGGPYTEPTFTYAIYTKVPAIQPWDAVENCLAVNGTGTPRAFTPLDTQRCIGLWTPADDGSLGWATMAPDTDGGNSDWRLLMCDESPIAERCNV